MSSILVALFFFRMINSREIRKIVRQTIVFTLKFQIQFHHNDLDHR